VASVNPESAHTGRDALRRLGRRPAVSHTGDTAVGCPDLRHGRRAPLDSPCTDFEDCCRRLQSPDLFVRTISHNIPFGQRSHQDMTLTLIVLANAQKLEIYKVT